MKKFVTQSHDTPDTNRFMQTQYAFAAHIRDPQQFPRPTDIEDRRMAIYRELFYNNVEDFMAGSFPVLRSILDEKQWHTLIRDYFANHRATTPLFPEMPREFVQYLGNEREANADDPAFLLELAHYEWVELALGLTDQDVELAAVDQQGDLLHEHPVLSSLAWPLEYRFPVHRISAEYQPVEAGDTATYLVVYRDLTDKIGFLEINPVTARLLQLLLDGTGVSGQQLLEQIATEINHPDPEAVVQSGLSILQDLHKRQIILGTSKPAN
jgi:hypothetical protein